MQLTQEQIDYLNNAVAYATTVQELEDAAANLPTPETVTPPGPRRASIDYWQNLSLTSAQSALVSQMN